MRQLDVDGKKREIGERRIDKKAACRWKREEGERFLWLGT